LSGKRQVIDGKHIITTAELIGIRKAEKVIWVKKGKSNNKVSRKRGSQAQQELTGESEAELELSEDDAKEIFDCIEVEF
jgi:hypothetical protein